MDLRSVPASEVMHKEVISLSSSMNLEEVRDIFLTNNISGAPVVDEDGVLVGVVSQTDLIQVGLAGDFDDFDDNELLIGFSAWGVGGDSETIGDRLRGKFVAEVMGGNIFTAMPDDSASYLAGE
ncbi:MAG: CBS domain-containing protein, partial [Bdellovibrionales bacterium]|nr:CBS domain-containing protein [Bdellovibrionales bacterium]